jgi:hypothetical protein
MTTKQLMAWEEVDGEESSEFDQDNGGPGLGALGLDGDGGHDDYSVVESVGTARSCSVSECRDSDEEPTTC